jgi:hypothetical protein
MCGACSHKILGTKGLEPYCFSSTLSKTVVIFNHSSFLSKFHRYMSSIYMSHGHTASPFDASSSIYTSGPLDCSYLTVPRLHIFLLFESMGRLSQCPAELVGRCCAPCSQYTMEHGRSRCPSSVMHQIVSFVGIGGIWDYMWLVQFNMGFVCDALTKLLL